MNFGTETIQAPMMFSLTTHDILGATPKPAFRFTNKPPKEEIPGTRPRTRTPWNRPVMNLTVADIPGARSASAPFLEMTSRSTNPINPTYQLPKYNYTPLPPTKFIRNSLDWSDLDGCTPKKLYATRTRDIISCEDIDGARSGTTPLSKFRHHYTKTRSVSSLDVQDIVGSKFKSTRQTNPLSPRYLQRMESDLGFMGRASSALGQNAKANPSAHQDTLPPRPETVAGFHHTTTSLTGKPTVVLSIGQVDRSHPGWRNKYENKPEKDASLRTSDIPGAGDAKPSPALYTQMGGVYCKSDRPRRETRPPNTLISGDIEGSVPVLKKDSMWRKQGRQSNPIDPVYIPLDGIPKAGLSEREFLSKPVNIRREITMSRSVEPDRHVAVTLESSKKLRDDIVTNAFKKMDEKDTGEVPYHHFMQGLNSLGVAIPSASALELAQQLDKTKTGKVPYKELPGFLDTAMSRHRKLEAEAKEKTGSGTKDLGDSTSPNGPKPAVKQSPLLRLKDKLYQKNEKMYDSFVRFDTNHSGFITHDDFVMAVQDLNVGIDKETAKSLAKHVDIDGDGMINYYEFSNRLDHGDDLSDPHLQSQSGGRSKVGSPASKSKAILKETPEAGIEGSAPDAQLTDPQEFQEPPKTAKTNSKQPSRAGSKGRVTPSLPPVDAKAAYEVLEREREIAELKQEMDAVHALPEGTPRIQK